MKIHEFVSLFPDETTCRQHFKELREDHGITCKKCAGTKHYWLQAKWQWQCRKCKFRTTLRSGTFLQHARLPIRKWYLCIALMSNIKKGLSAKEVQRQLGHPRYRTIWILMQKIRLSLSKEENEMRLKIQCSFLKHKQKQLDFHYNNLTLELKFSSKTFSQATQPGMYMPKKIFLTGSKKSLLKINDCYDAYFLNDSNKRKASKNWPSILRSNFNRILTGIHHRISLTYLQNYLDEYCFKINHKNEAESFFMLYLKVLIRNELWYTFDQSHYVFGKET